VFSVGLEDIDIKRVDTAHTPVDPGTYGSRVTVLAGEAAINAAKDAKRMLLEAAAKEFGVKPEEMDIKNKKAFVKTNPEMSIPWARGENARQPIPSWPSTARSPSSIQRFSIEYDG
jgi:CO/xanthine dehydrogenase Mo-binding subunit